jgi:cytochrome c oxidase subunit 2
MIKLSRSRREENSGGVFTVLRAFALLALSFFMLSFLNSPAMASTLPVAATDLAKDWDTLYWFLMWLSGFFFVGICIAMAIFVWKYRSTVYKRPKYIHGSTTLEIIWTVIPTILLMWIFVWGFQVYHEMIHAPQDAMEVNVIGKQWLWQFVYKNGTSSIGDLYVPLNKPVKLVMSSEDVIHSFFVPNFRMKSDVVP